ncbi:YidH family protein [Thermobifida cellulosilytica]|uniref:DUF202 domain-containing protein n=1 Tax=Thermobifida cellulosilytica TB100 TaxID=665004 RepID=A0A147KM40_THECS|nr:hypothetical protein AC529_02475 [Thermobifida cellulosilytica TB100]
MGVLSGADGGGGKEPDYRFTLANERTFLAWIRTALALVAGSVAVLHLVPLRWHDGTQASVGVGLAVLAVAITGYAPVRWWRVQRAMRESRPLPPTPLPLVTAIGVALIGLAVVAGYYWP